MSDPRATGPARALFLGPSSLGPSSYSPASFGPLTQKAREKEQVAEVVRQLKEVVGELKTDRQLEVRGPQAHQPLIQPLPGPQSSPSPSNNHPTNSTMSMMDEDSGSLEEHTPLCERKEWEDFEPLEIDDGRKVVCIQYTPDHREALAFFKRIVQLGELSERALALTTDLIGHNQADYTAWEWRWKCLCALKKDLNTEYQFTDGIMHDNAKNYQLWNHRRKCALALGAKAAHRELEVAGEALDADAKNYHAWAHRQAIVKEFGGVLWEEELCFSERLIEDDVRNNSAWNQRAFVCLHQLHQQAVISERPEVALHPDHPLSSLTPILRVLMPRELDYVTQQVLRAPRNESSWNYLRGLFNLPGMPPHAIGMFEEVGVLCRDALGMSPSSPPAMDVFAHFYLSSAHISLTRMRQLVEANQGQGTAASAKLTSACQVGHQLVQSASTCSTELLVGLLQSDPVRSMYWRHKQQAAQAVLAASLALLQSLGINLPDDVMGQDVAAQNDAAAQG